MLSVYLGIHVNKWAISVKFEKITFRLNQIVMLCVIFRILVRLSVSNFNCSCMFQTLPDSAVSTYAASLKDKGALVPALYKVIRENYSDVCTRNVILLFM